MTIPTKCVMLLCSARYITSLTKQHLHCGQTCILMPINWELKQFCSQSWELDNSFPFCGSSRPWWLDTSFCNNQEMNHAAGFFKEMSHHILYEDLSWMLAWPQLKLNWWYWPFLHFLSTTDINTNFDKVQWDLRDLQPKMSEIKLRLHRFRSCHKLRLCSGWTTSDKV